MTEQSYSHRTPNIINQSSDLCKLFRYDCEEHTTMFDGDNAMYLGDESSYKKKEAPMPKKLVSSLFVYQFDTFKYIMYFGFTPGRLLAKCLQ